MTTIHTLEIGQYVQGDIARVHCVEPDPIEDWPTFAEANAHDLRSIRLDGELVGCCGYVLCAPHEADAFAVIDRAKCNGSGPALAAAVRARQLQWMQECGVTIVHADCPSKDRAARVFLRAIGYRPIKGDDPDTSFFIFDRSK